MKKIGLAILAAGLITSATSFAGPVANNKAGYHGSFGAVNTQKALFPSTDISIINASDSAIKVTVPNTPVDEWVHTQASPYHVTNWNGAFFTNIIIQDEYYNTIFNSTVCPRALITIYGGYGHYTWNVDEEYCY